MFNRLIMIGITIIGFIFIGCANNGMAVNTVSDNKVDRYFERGIIKEQKKVVIDNRELAILTGVGVGAIGGAVASGDVEGGVIGAFVGGISGALIGKEVIAYETTIISDGKEYKGFLEKSLQKNTVVEFTIKDKKLKNVTVISLPKQNTLTSGKVEKKSEIRAVKSTKKVLAGCKFGKLHDYTEITGIITKRWYIKQGKRWYYTLSTKDSSLTLSSCIKYPYLRDRVTLTYGVNITNYKIIVKIKLLEREALKKVTVAKKLTVEKQPFSIKKKINPVAEKTEVVIKTVEENTKTVTEEEPTKTKKVDVDNLWN